jgi:hypothetical protein
VTADELRYERIDPDDRIRLLLLTNERIAGDEFGLRDEFEQLHRRGVIAAYQAVAPRALAESGADWAAAVRQAANEVRPNVILVLSPGHVPDDPALVRQLVATGAHILYWEGDAWGAGKPMSPSMLTWSSIADVVFSVSGAPQTGEFLRHGARGVRMIPQTYCHVQFAAEESQPPPFAIPAHDIVMIGSKTTRFGVISRVSGGRGRTQLVHQLSRQPGLDMALYGTGWRGPHACGRVLYKDQVQRIREAKVTVNWDHFPTYAQSSSDRLPISLLAGRVHVTTRHPGTPQFHTDALIEVDEPAAVVAAARELLGGPWEELYERGMAGWEYARHRLSDREAARFMLRAIDLRVPAPPEDPWSGMERLASQSGWAIQRGNAELRRRVRVAG